MQDIRDRDDGVNFNLNVQMCATIAQHNRPLCSNDHTHSSKSQGNQTKIGRRNVIGKIILYTMSEPDQTAMRIKFQYIFMFMFYFQLKRPSLPKLDYTVFIPHKPGIYQIKNVIFLILESFFNIFQTRPYLSPGHDFLTSSFCAAGGQINRKINNKEDQQVPKVKKVLVDQKKDFQQGRSTSGKSSKVQKMMWSTSSLFLKILRLLKISFYLNKKDNFQIER